jgi:hypothetical protein
MELREDRLAGGRPLRHALAHATAHDLEVLVRDVELDRGAIRSARSVSCGRESGAERGIGTCDLQRVRLDAVADPHLLDQQMLRPGPPADGSNASPAIPSGRSGANTIPTRAKAELSPGGGALSPPGKK